VRVLLAVFFVAATAGAPAGLFQAGGQAEPPQLERAELLTAWLDAVDGHRPGTADDSVRRVAAWSQGELRTLREHFPTVISLIREPDLVIFFRDAPGSAPLQQMVYSVTELRELRALADTSGTVSNEDRCPRDPPGPGRGVNGGNNLLKRAAMLHLDVAAAITMRASAPAVPPRQPASRDSSFLVKVDDGRSMGTFSAAGHLEMGRDLLDRVAAPCSTRRAPARDPWVRDWYATSLAYQLTQQQFEISHLLRAVDLFRDDAAILALAGASHETLSTPLMQAAVGDDRDLRARVQLRSPSGELGRSEDLLRRALQRDQRHTEARLRLGNVLVLRGRHGEALRELDRVVAEAGEHRLLAYYARLLRGRELEALDRRAEARAAYEQAGQLFPAAQTPRIALSQLLRASGDAAAAAALLERLVDAAADDPWWEYYAAAGRSYEDMARALGAATPAAVRP
jgi:hypothetical protein